MFGRIICLKFKNIRYVQRQNRMVKTRKIKVKSIENEEIIIVMTKAIITKIIITTIMTMRIKIGNRIKI